MPVIAYRVTAVVVTVLTVTVLTACSQAEPTTPSVAPSTRTTAPSTTTSSTVTATTQPLTDAESAWLAAVSKIAATLNRGLVGGPEEVTTRSSMLAMADTLRGCSRGLARIGPPSQRLQPVYQAVKQACGHYDKAAGCTQTAAAAIGTPITPGSPEERKITQAMDCVSAGVTDGGTSIADAQAKSIQIRAASGDL
jgi:hypothetical protein